MPEISRIPAEYLPPIDELPGDMHVLARPGREMTASGTLTVAGRYAAYGQKLEIKSGRLVWSNDPIANPLLDIRAEREVGEVTAGIRVSGRATAPQADVYTHPETDQSQALAYLALGRPLLLGWSRKSTLGHLTGRGVADRLAASIAAARAAVQHGARIVRVHDVAQTADALRVWSASGLTDTSFHDQPSSDTA